MAYLNNQSERRNIMTSNQWAKKSVRIAAMSLAALSIGFGIRTIVLNPEVLRGDYELPAFTVTSIEKYYPNADGVDHLPTPTSMR